jgi:hypothetical protein
MDAPKRAKLLTESEDPKWAKSNTDRENTEPNLAIPNTDTADPTRTKLRSDSDAPMCEKSSTDKAAPRRAKALNATDEPTVM